jgi:hypothetical protein
MLDFDDNAHKFQVTPQSPQLALEFGATLFFTSLTTGMPINELEAAGTSKFNSFLVFPALSFHAEAIALVPRVPNAAAAEVQFRRKFEFGFVQGTTLPSVHLEYWGKTRADGRSIVHISMPPTFEVDTDPSTQPWTRTASSRFKVTNVTKHPSGPMRFKIEADFADHPMVMLPHTIGTPSLQRFIRWVRFTRDFRTIFCVLDKPAGSFDAISATQWRVPFDHLVSYTGGGSNRKVDNRAGSPNFPRGGSPSDVHGPERDILAMAGRGAPLVTAAVLDARFKDPARRTETDETPNADFDPSFWA